MNKNKFSNKTVKSVKEIGPDTFIIEFNRDFDFIPGQVIGITNDQNIPERLYSIASGKNDENIKILFNIKEEGYLSPKLASMNPGDKIFITPPFGDFICNEDEAVWIAAGTGIAPFLSMVLSGQSKNKALIHGARTIDSFFFSDLFITKLGKNYTRCSSLEKGDGIFEGRLTRYLSETEFLRPDIKYYLCGSAEMVTQTRDILIQRDIPWSQIIAEIYF